MSSPSQSAEVESNDPETRQVPYSAMRAGGWDIYLVLLNSSLLDLKQTQADAQTLKRVLIEDTQDMVFCRAGLADFYFAVPPGTEMYQLSDFEHSATITKIRTFASKEEEKQAVTNDAGQVNMKEVFGALLVLALAGFLFYAGRAGWFKPFFCSPV